MFALEVGYLREITTRNAVGAGILPPVHVLLTHYYFCFPELLVHFFCLYYISFETNFKY